MPSALSEPRGSIDIESRGSQHVESSINVDHIEENKWGPPLVNAAWHAVCQAIFKGIEEKEREELSAGARKLSESQKAKAIWAKKAAKDRGEEYYDPVRKEDI